MTHPTALTNEEPGYPLTRYDPAPYSSAESQAERFVDDVTLLRMMRRRFPLANPEIGGISSTTIKQIHTAHAQLEKWGQVADQGTAWQGVVDVAYRFTDESIAIRIAATQRWEVWRSW